MFRRVQILRGPFVWSRPNARSRAPDGDTAVSPRRGRDFLRMCGFSEVSRVLLIPLPTTEGCPNLLCGASVGCFMQTIFWIFGVSEVSDAHVVRRTEGCPHSPVWNPLPCLAIMRCDQRWLFYLVFILDCCGHDSLPLPWNSPVVSLRQLSATVDNSAWHEAAAFGGRVIAELL